jgi:hypothetical protein
MENGYIKLHRKLTQWEWYKDSTTLHFFIHCLMRANHSDNFCRGVEIKRGQFTSSREILSNETGISLQSIRTSEARLIKSQNLTSKSTSQFMLYGIVNYELYQDTKINLTSKSTNEQQTTNKPSTTNKNVKNDKNIIYPEFLPVDLFNDFLEMRKKIKKPATDNAVKLLIGKLEKFHQQGLDITAIIQNSLVNNWQDLFPEKEQFKKKGYNVWKN